MASEGDTQPFRTREAFKRRRFFFFLFLELFLILAFKGEMEGLIKKSVRDSLLIRIIIESKLVRIGLG